MSEETSAQDKYERIVAWEILAVVLLMVVGGALRFWGAHAAPGFWYDEAIYALDGLDVWRKPGWPVFFDTEDHMREGLFMYLLAPAFAMFGVTVEVARSTSAVIGIATIPAVWLMIRNFFGRRAGMIGAILVTFLYWHLQFSSLAFRTILTPLFAAITALLMSRFVRKPTMTNAIVAGSVLGLGAYTYLAWRLVPVMLVVFGLIALRMRKRFPFEIPGRRELLAIPAAAIIVFVPMAVDFAKHPNHFMGRAAEVNIPGHALQKTLFMTRQTVDVGLNYGLRGDPMERHNMLGDPTRLQIFWWRVPGIEELARWADKRTAGTAPELHGAGLPVFDIITAIFFYLGVFVCAHRASRGGWRELALLLWMAIGSLASILSYGAPNLLRMTILIPAVVAILVVGLSAAADRVDKRFGAKAALAFMLVFALNSAVVQVRRFVAWPTHPNTAPAFNSDFAQLGTWLHKNEINVPVVIQHQMWDHATLRFTADGVTRVADLEFDPSSAPQGWIEARTRLPWPPLGNITRVVPMREELLTTLHYDGYDWVDLVRVTPVTPASASDPTPQ